MNCNNKIIYVPLSEEKRSFESGSALIFSTDPFIIERLYRGV
jgi:hypothetical protein